MAHLNRKKDKTKDSAPNLSISRRECWINVKSSKHLENCIELEKRTQQVKSKGKLTKSEEAPSPVGGVSLTRSS